MTWIANSPIWTRLWTLIYELNNAISTMNWLMNSQRRTEKNEFFMMNWIIILLCSGKWKKNSAGWSEMKTSKYKLKHELVSPFCINDEITTYLSWLNSYLLPMQSEPCVDVTAKLKALEARTAAVKKHGFNTKENDREQHRLRMEYLNIAAVKKMSKPCPSCRMDLHKYDGWVIDS